MVNPAIFAIAANQGRSTMTARQALIERLTKAKAFEPSRAIALDPSSELTELVGRAIVRPRGGGLYYLDRERQKDQGAGQGWLGLAILVGIASVMASVIAILVTR